MTDTTKTDYAEPTPSPSERVTTAIRIRHLERERDLAISAAKHEAENADMWRKRALELEPMSASEAVGGLLPCPFCNEIPEFSGPVEMDDRRYMRMQLSCCITMNHDVSYPNFDKLTADDFKRALTAEWNRRAAPVPDSETAKQKYDRFMAGDDGLSPIESLRFFCSIAMTGQDWLDSEPFFDALTAPTAPVPANEAAILKSMRQSFQTTQITPRPSGLNSYEMVFAFPSIKAMHDAVDEWYKFLAAPAAPTDAKPYCWCIASMNSADWAFAATRDDVIENAKLMDADCIKTAPFPLHTANPAAQSVRDAAQPIIAPRKGKP